MTLKEKLPRRNFVDHYRGRKGPFIFVLSMYSMIVLILLSSVNEGTNITDLLLVITGFTLLISWVLYGGFAEYKRIVEFLEKSGVLNLLIERGFEVVEEKSGLNYEFFIQGQIDGYLIVVAVDKPKANIWGKYYLILLGVADGQRESVEAKYSHRVGIREYKEPILLTKSAETKSKLDRSISQFIKELKGTLH